MKNISNVNNADEEFLRNLTMEKNTVIKKQTDLNNAIQELSTDEINTTEIFNYIIQTSKEILDESREVLTGMGQVLQSLPDPEFAKSYSSILQSMASVVRNVTDVAASKEKANAQLKVTNLNNENKLEIKEMDIKHKNELLERKHDLDMELQTNRLQDEGPKTVNVIMTREEVFQKLFKSEEYLNSQPNFPEVKKIENKIEDAEIVEKSA